MLRVVVVESTQVQVLLAYILVRRCIVIVDHACVVGTIYLHRLIFLIHHVKQVHRGGLTVELLTEL